MTIREVVFAMLADDPTMNGLGINSDSLFGNYAPDSPPYDRFAVLHWGLETPTLLGAEKRVTDLSVVLWPYDIDQDFARISAINRRWCGLMDSLTGTPTGDGGWVLKAAWGGDGEDGWDDVYERVFRTSSYTLTMTG